jgi:branched-subunit amino acid transport protein
MSWWFIVALAAGCYAFKVIGLILVGDRTMPPVVARCLALIPAAMISALVALNTFSDGQELVIDARVAGVAAAVIATWRKAPLIVVIILGAGVTAAVRAIA